MLVTAAIHIFAIEKMRCDDKRITKGDDRQFKRFFQTESSKQHQGQTAKHWVKHSLLVMLEITRQNAHKAEGDNKTSQTPVHRFFRYARAQERQRGNEERHDQAVDGAEP